MDLTQILKEQAINDLQAIGMGRVMPRQTQFAGFDQDTEVALMLDKKLLESEAFFNQFTFGELQQLQRWIKHKKAFQAVE